MRVSVTSVTEADRQEPTKPGVNGTEMARRQMILNVLSLGGHR
jgi:hypothetical protein